MAEAFQDKVSESGEDFGALGSLSRRFPVCNAKEVIRALWMEREFQSTLKETKRYRMATKKLEFYYTRNDRP